MAGLRLSLLAIGLVCLLAAASTLACGSGDASPTATPAKPRTSVTPDATVPEAATATSSPAFASSPTPVISVAPTLTPTAIVTSSPTVIPGVLAPSVPSKGEIGRGNTARAQIALTIDAGSGAAATPSILDTLKKKGVRATFFLTGEWTDRYPDMARQIADGGHQLANHSYSHPDFTTISNKEIQQEIERTESAIHRATGKSPSRFLRPPFGARDARVIAQVESLGYREVYWTLDSTDWRPESTADFVLRRVVNNASNGSIVVMHANAQQTAESLGEIIDQLRAKGYDLVTLDQVIAP